MAIEFPYTEVRAALRSLVRSTWSVTGRIPETGEEYTRGSTFRPVVIEWEKEGWRDVEASSLLSVKRETRVHLWWFTDKDDGTDTQDGVATKLGQMETALYANANFTTAENPDGYLDEPLTVELVDVNGKSRDGPYEVKPQSGVRGGFLTVRLTMEQV